MLFYYIVAAVISIAALLNGWMAFRLCRNRLKLSLASLALGIISSAYFAWYAFHYVDHGPFFLGIAYVLCGFMMGTLLELIPVFVVFLLSYVKKLTKIASVVLPLLFIAAWGAGIYGSVDGNNRLVVEHVTIASPDVPPAFDGYKIALMADTHIGPYFRGGDLGPEIERAHEEGAQMIAFSGDLIDDVRFMPEAAKVFKEKYSEFPDGIFYTWGNHEYYRDKPFIEGELRTTPLRFVVNSHQEIERNGDTLYVAGVDFPFGPREGKDKQEEAMTDAAYQGVPKGAFSILLAHHSDFIKEGIEHGAVLTLTGHTHGTQIGFLGQPLFTPFTYTRGLYTDGDGHYGYVTRGDGSWLPFRLGCPRELVIFTLKRA
jgi:predicted MPP superfamily phosphohydrolase